MKVGSSKLEVSPPEGKNNTGVVLVSKSKTVHKGKGNQQRKKK